MSISKDIYLRMVSLDPLKFALVCVTAGGPATQMTWGKNGIQSIPNTVGVKSQKVVNYEDAMYINEIVISTYIIAGTYTFHSSNAVTNEVSSTLDVSGICRLPFSDLAVLCFLYNHRCQATAIQWKHSVQQQHF